MPDPLLARVLKIHIEVLGSRAFTAQAGKTETMSVARILQGRWCAVRVFYFMLTEGQCFHFETPSRH